MCTCIYIYIYMSIYGLWIFPPLGVFCTLHVLLFTRYLGLIRDLGKVKKPRKSPGSEPPPPKFKKKTGPDPEFEGLFKTEVRICGQHNHNL